MTKITLATLASATARQVFDQVRDHMLRQGERSMLLSGGLTCAYRSHDGFKCAAGCLMADDEYANRFERHDWSKLVARGFAPAAHAHLTRTYGATSARSRHTKPIAVMSRITSERTASSPRSPALTSRRT